jgi:hypothetical protein
VNKLGHVPSRAKAPGDEPDFSYDPVRLGLSSAGLPNEASLRDQVLGVLDQGLLGSCVANAGMQAIRMAHVRQGVKNPKLGSRLFGYFFARAYDHMTKEDGGTEIRLFYQALNKFGFPPEEIWGYDDAPVGENGEPGKFATLPSALAVRAAYDQHAPSVYRRLNGTGASLVEMIKTALAVGKQPVEFGTLVTKAYTNDDLGPSGIVDVPSPDAEIAGGHAQLVTGYRVLSTGRTIFEVLGSWGSSFAEDGFCWYTEDYLTWASTTDLWVVDHTPLFS